MDAHKTNPIKSPQSLAIENATLENKHQSPAYIKAVRTEFGLQPKTQQSKSVTSTSKRRNSHRQANATFQLNKQTSSEIKKEMLEINDQIKALQAEIDEAIKHDVQKKIERFQDRLQQLKEKFFELAQTASKSEQVEKQPIPQIEKITGATFDTTLSVPAS